MSHELIKHVTETSFEQDVVGAEGPVLVDFWAPWCGPCRAVAPTLEEIAATHEGKVRIAKVNVDDAPAVANRYGVRGIPTLMLFKDGAVAATKVGAAPKGQLVGWLDDALAA